MTKFLDTQGNDYTKHPLEKHPVANSPLEEGEGGSFLKETATGWSSRRLSSIYKHVKIKYTRGMRWLSPNTKYTKTAFTAICLSGFILFAGCSPDDKNLIYIPPKKETTVHKIDKYLYDNNGKSILEKYGTVIRWRFNNRMKGLDEDVVPVRKNLVIPMTKLMQYVLIQPYQLSNPTAGDKIVNQLLPLEINYIGSLAFTDGRATPKAAHAGKLSMTLYALNYLFQGDTISIANAQGLAETLHHEIVHVANGRYGFPEGFDKVSPRYAGARFGKLSLNGAIKLGMVTTYGASTPDEDIAELVALYLAYRPQRFSQTYLDIQNCERHKNNEEALKDCRALNEGRKLIAKKLEITKKYYEMKVKINLDSLRKIVQERLYDVDLLNKAINSEP